MFWGALNLEQQATNESIIIPEKALTKLLVITSDGASKNNDNGNVFWLIEDVKNKLQCSVKAWKRIYIRAIKLKIAINKTTAVFTGSKKSKKKTCHFNDMHINSLLQ